MPGTLIRVLTAHKRVLTGIFWMETSVVARLALVLLIGNARHTSATIVRGTWKSKSLLTSPGGCPACPRATPGVMGREQK